MTLSDSVMMKNVSSILPIAAGLALAISGQSAGAAILALYNFDGSSMSSFDDDATNTNWTATALADGPGISSINGASVGNPTPARSMEGNETDSNTEDGAVTANDYFQFTITPTVGNTMNLSQISLDFAASYNTQIRGFAVRTSLDGYSSSVWNVTVPINGDGTALVNYSTSLAASQYQNLTSGITFRIYGFDNATSASSYLRFDNITVTGSVVPEPSAVLFSAASAGLVLLRRKRKPLIATRE